MENEYPQLAAGHDESPAALFTGRDAELRAVVDWMRQRHGGIRVVTGGPGTGKSALLGRIIALSDPRQRRALLSDQDRWRVDPGAATVHAYAEARGATVDSVAAQWDAGLVRSGVLEPAGAARAPAELIGALRSRDVSGRLPVLILDGLDEAGGPAFEIAEELLIRLAPLANVIVATQDGPADIDGRKLTDVLSPGAVLDLDRPECIASQRSAVHRYLRRRLSGVAATMDPERVADELLNSLSALDPGFQLAELVVDRLRRARQGSRSRRQMPPSAPPFLLARIVVDRLRAHPIDTGAPNWRRALIRSVDAALDTDIARIPADEVLPDGADPAELARTMLVAATWSFGAGFPEAEWLTVASRSAGTELTAAHLRWLLRHLGRYVTRSEEYGAVVYRLAHQRLAEYLNPALRQLPARTEPPVWAALADRYESLLRAGQSGDAPGYLAHYGARHAAAAGLDGLRRLRELAELDARLAPDLAAATLEVAAAGRYRNGPATVSLAETAVRLYRGLAEARPALARALRTLGQCYRRAGRDLDAIEAVTQAIELYRELAEDNPAHEPDLAHALRLLGDYYQLAGRREHAHHAIVQSIQLYRKIAEANPIQRRELNQVIAIRNSLEAEPEISREPAPERNRRRSERDRERGRDRERER